MYGKETNIRIGGNSEIAAARTALMPLRVRGADIITDMRSSARPGFTLLEVVVAAFVFAVGVLALEATAVTVLRQMRRSADLAVAASTARTRLEKLAGSRCASVIGGADTIDGVVSVWTVEETPSPSIRGVSQTVTYELGYVQRSDSYRAMVQCSP